MTIKRADTGVYVIECDECFLATTTATETDNGWPVMKLGWMYGAGPDTDYEFCPECVEKRRARFEQEPRP